MPVNYTRSGGVRIHLSEELSGADALDYVDEVVVREACAGRRRWGSLRMAERIEVVARLTECGWDDPCGDGWSCERIAGWLAVSERTAQRARALGRACDVVDVAAPGGDDSVTDWGLTLVSVG